MLCLKHWRLETFIQQGLLFSIQHGDLNHSTTLQSSGAFAKSYPEKLKLSINLLGGADLYLCGQLWKYFSEEVFLPRACCAVRPVLIRCWFVGWDLIFRKLVNRFSAFQAQSAFLGLERSLKVDGQLIESWIGRTSSWLKSNRWKPLNKKLIQFSYTWSFWGLCSI